MSFQYPQEPKLITFAEFVAAHPWRIRIGDEYRYHSNEGVCRKYERGTVEWFDGKTWREM